MDAKFWKNKKVLVTGGTGFIGSHLVEKLVSLDAFVTVMHRSSNIHNLHSVKHAISFYKGDCLNMDDALKASKGKDIVMNLAARVGGIEYNRTHHATMLRDNLFIALNMIEAARVSNVQRFLVVSSACVYPHDAIVPTPESEGFRDEPEETNQGYGWAKRMAEKLGQYYVKEFGMHIVIARPYNAYGPRDHFDSKFSHVIPALIRRVFDGENPIVVWGSGKQTRSFLYVEDFVDGLLLAVEKSPVGEVINFGSDEEVTIEDLIKEIIRLSHKNVKIVFDTTKPDGSPRRKSDNTKAISLLGFQAKTSLRDGLRKTIDWYLHEKK